MLNEIGSKYQAHRSKASSLVLGDSPFCLLHTDGCWDMGWDYRDGSPPRWSSQRDSELWEPEKFHVRLNFMVISSKNKAEAKGFYDSLRYLCRGMHLSGSSVGDRRSQIRSGVWPSGKREKSPQWVRMSTQSDLKTNMQKSDMNDII